MTRCALLWLCAVSLGAADRPIDRVSGVVRNQVTRAPIADARVYLSPSSSAARNTSTLSGPDGRFAFDNVAPGKYAVGGQRRGYVSTNYGQTPLGAGIAVVVEPKALRHEIELLLPPGAAIGGRVLDDAGEPVKGALVQLFQASTAGGVRRVSPASYRWTNDRGEYRFSNLRAGTYYACASGEPWYAHQMPGTAFPPSCYGGSADPRQAAPLTLKAGQELAADFTLLSANGVALTVKGRSASNYVVWLTRDGPGGVEWFLRSQESYGVCTFYGVPPGSYWVKGRKPTGELLFQRQRVDVDGSGAFLELKPPRPLLVLGQATLDKPPDRAPAVLQLRPAEGGRGALTRQIDAGGAFSFTDLPPDRYVLYSAASRGYYIDKLTVEGAPLEGRTLDLTDVSAPVKVSIRMRSDGGRVEGKVLRGEKPVAGALVLLVPATDSKEPTDYFLFVSDGDGSFDYVNVKPGAYQIFATDLEELEYANPDAIRRFRKTAQAVTVETGGRQSLDVPLSPARE